MSDVLQTRRVVVRGHDDVKTHHFNKTRFLGTETPAVPGFVA